MLTQEKCQCSATVFIRITHNNEYHIVGGEKGSKDINPKKKSATNKVFTL